MQARMTHFDILMLGHTLAKQMKKNGEHHKAYYFMHELSSDLLAYIIQETKGLFQFQQYILDACRYNEYFLNLYHLQGHITIENDCFRLHYNSLLSTASYIHYLKNLSSLPTSAKISRQGIFDRPTNSPVIDFIEERPSPPPGFGLND